MQLHPALCNEEFGSGSGELPLDDASHITGMFLDLRSLSVNTDIW
jgi:hypothetical protein